MEKENSPLIVLSYIPFLFLIPMFTIKNSEFADFHKKQGIVLFIVFLILSAVDFSVRLVSFMFSLSVLIIVDYIIAVLWLGFLTLMVFGILKVTKDEKRRLPLIGRFVRKK